MQLKNKVAVITGGSSGIGLATAKRFVDEGAYVYITGRRQSELDKARALIGKNVTAVKSDVGNRADLDHLYQVVAAEKDVKSRFPAKRRRGASVVRKNWPRRFCSWPRTAVVTSPASTFRSMGASRRSEFATPRSLNARTFR